MSTVAGQLDGRRTRRRRAARLSALAGLITALIFGADALSRPSVSVWLLWIAVPPIALSGAAAFQYRRREGTGAGAAAAATYWVSIYLFTFSAGPAYLPGAVLQTVAWFGTRPRRPRDAREQTAIDADRSPRPTALP
jgi:hypothetical protein